ncbi:uncharacterized protein LOC100186704 [Ciona intestinalis]
MLADHTQHAQYIIQRAEQCEVRKKSLPSSSKWRSIHSQLHDVFVEEEEDDDGGEPITKRAFFSHNTLETLCTKDKSLNRLIVNLFPLDGGYSVMLRGGNGQYVETIQLPYTEYDVLDYIDNEEIPPLLMKTFENLEKNIFYSGCVITEIRDYRIAAGPHAFQTKFVLLRPTQQTLLSDANNIVNETSKSFRWTAEDRLSLESYLTLGTAEPLCLDPSPSVGIVKNILQARKKFFKTRPFQQCVRRNGLLGLKRRKVQSTRPAPESLKLFDFMKKLRSSRKSPPATDIRLPKNIVDTWRKVPLELDPPKSEIEVGNYAKALTPRPPSITDSDLLEVQQVHLKSEGANRDVYSLIKILQRPSDMHYFGKLQSNKYIQGETGRDISNSCRFSLGTEHRANLYILQYQELFAEDGRRPATVTVSRPLQQNTAKYQIPLQQQPWQLEQDKSLYSVGSINNIPAKHWHKLKVNDNIVKPAPIQPLPINPQRITTFPAQAPPTASTNQQPVITTPTLNTITLQPSSQSSFMFPLPRQVTHQQTPTISAPSPVPLQSPIPGTRVVGQRLGSLNGETFNLLTGADGGIYQIKEAGPSSGKRSRQNSQDVFNFTTQSGFTTGQQQLTFNNNQRSGTPLITATAQEASSPAPNNNLIQNFDQLMSMQNTLNQGGSVSVQLPLSMALNTQQPQVVGQVRLQKPPQQQQNTIIRMPVSIASGPPTTTTHQVAINILGGGRNVISQQPPTILGNIQLSGSRLPGGTLTIPASQLPPALAAQIAAQLNQDKPQTSKMTEQHFTVAASDVSSTPITILTNNNSNVQGQIGQVRAVTSNRIQQQITQQSDNKGGTITFNVRGTNAQQPVQLLQVSGTNTIQQLPIRAGQQLVLNTVRSSPIEQSSSPQMALAQHLQQLASGSGGNSNPKPVRSRKRKSTPVQK